ncbi:predicted protein [Sclerotinia sclerotiorum 1980 UF-70]|uniref:Uncharacterized protein n=1 Tax=Sclerotinia sclerotiorum (strain ATCC 18683 / 1980 / Ss-1) TaxID=665079 RepID=A7E4U7_SCLS1|nr:predicted protein [Sclerotinia sclerotiorum 1980 UF-70]EDN90919.1 predicted protein [Sclerotinia sclerotiorum 1980 UF-70]
MFCNLYSCRPIEDEPPHTKIADLSALFMTVDGLWMPEITKRTMAAAAKVIGKN